MKIGTTVNLYDNRNHCDIKLQTGKLEANNQCIIIKRLNKQTVMTESSYAIYTQGAKRKVEKIEIIFQDSIKDSNKDHKLSLFEWIRIDELKKHLQKEHYHETVRWNDIRLFYKNIELLPNNRRLIDFEVQPDSTIIMKKVEENDNFEKGIVNPYKIFDQVPDQIQNMLLAVQSGLNNDKKPKLAEEGTSGTYFLENHMKKVVAIFKPFDQQPFADNNPRGLTGSIGTEGMRKGIYSGQSATREVAAYLLDQSKFHSVPETTYVQFFHPTFIKKSETSNPIMSDVLKVLNKENQLKTKHGSLQAFVESNDIAGNMGSNQFDVEEIHKIGILDLRILNCDRNEANILVRRVMVGKQNPKKLLKLIPIDHGLTFPDNFQIYDYEMVWMGYRQSSKPFSEKSMKFIRSIDPIRDCQRLRQKLGFRQICLRNFRIAQTFLKRMACEGFTLQEIGEMMYRKDDDDEYQESHKNEANQEIKSAKQIQGISDLQRIVNQAENIYFLVKQNGIKSTVNFQLNFCKEKKQQQSLPQLNEKPSKSETGNLLSTSLEKKQLELEKSSSKTKTSPCKIRNVSLPNLKIRKNNSKVDREKRRNKKRKGFYNSKALQKKKQDDWDQIFFHYFEEFLDRFIDEKRRKKRPALIQSRSRIMSEDINYDY